MPPKLDRVFIFNVTIVIEAFLLLGAIFWTYLNDQQLLPLFHCRQRSILMGVFAGLLCASSGFITLGIGRLSGNRWQWIEQMRIFVLNELAPIFSTLTFVDILIIAATTGFCEEVFFRGVLQSQLGLPATALLFGFFHCPSVRHLPYGLWATGAGIFLGWLFIDTHCLWTPILAHAISNFIVLLYMRYYAKPVPES
jgi:membrane protease YdiL (CAAX protease family)